MCFATPIKVLSVCLLILLAHGLAAIDPTSTATTTALPVHMDMCSIRGTLHTSQNWHGYLMERVLFKYARLIYSVSYPKDQLRDVRLVFYHQDQLKGLTASMTCLERVNVVDKYAIIPLDLQQESHCQTVESKEDGKGVLVHCSGEKIFTTHDQRRWSIVVAHCGDVGPLDLQYTLNITGYVGDCEEDPLARYKLPNEITDDKICRDAIEANAAYETVTTGHSGNGGLNLTLNFQFLFMSVLAAVYIIQ